VDWEDFRRLKHYLTGESFITGDVLLEIETDKAQMDVEAQDDGKMAKITVLRPSDQDYSHLLRRIGL
jgi:pyruvate carboxylase